jgi:polyisoprenoid-binding protein YceI
VRATRFAALAPLLVLTAGSAPARTPFENPPAAAAPPRVLAYRFLPQKSILKFELPTTFHTVHGEVGAWKGEIEILPNEPGRLRGRIVIKAGSLTTANVRRDADMDAKVLETGIYPDIVFEATGYSGDLSTLDSGSATVTVTGTLTIHGVGRPVEVPVECALIEDHAIVAGAVPLHWREFGLHDPSRWFSKVGDPMMVVFRLWAVPEGEETR